MRMIVTILVAAFFAVSSAETPYDVHPASKRLLERKPLHLTAEGTVEFPFEKVSSILMHENLLSAIQESYAAALPEGERPEFTVCQLKQGFYHYTNRHGEETTIEEVWIRNDPGSKISVALYSEGSRFFGKYQSLCDVVVTPIDDGVIAYEVTVFARPESFAVRLFARLAPVELYFRHKMDELTDLVVRVCNRIPLEESSGEDYACSPPKHIFSR